MPSPTFQPATSIVDVLHGLLEKYTILTTRLSELESTVKTLSATPSPVPIPSATKQLPTREHLIAPTSTPTHNQPSTSPININTLSSKAAFEKTVVSLLIPDDQAGHVVGKAGAGLKQIHDFSGAKVIVSATSNSAGLRTVTIRGTAREVGDAVNALGKRLAHRRIRTKKKAVFKPSTSTSIPSQKSNTSGSNPSLPDFASFKSDVTPSTPIPSQKSIASASNPSDFIPPILPHSEVIPSSHPPSIQSTPSLLPGTPMSIVPPSSIQSPMHLDAVRPVSTGIRSGKPVGSRYWKKKR